MKIVKPHGTTAREAREKLERAFPGLIARFGDSVSQLEHTWHGEGARFSFKATGFNVKGTLVVNEKDVVLDLKLPFAAMMFEGAIRPRVEQELERILNGETA